MAKKSAGQFLKLRASNIWRSSLLYNYPETNRLVRFSAIVWVLLGAVVWVAAEPIASLRATNYVNDFAVVLDAATLARLNDLCHQVEQKAQAQIAVVTVKSVDGQEIGRAHV